MAIAEPRSAIASEGLSLVAARGPGALVAYGGYNGRYHSSVNVFRPGACKLVGLMRRLDVWAV